jgi:hypothetical protein
LELICFIESKHMASYFYFDLSHLINLDSTNPKVPLIGGSSNVCMVLRPGICWWSYSPGVSSSYFECGSYKMRHHLRPKLSIYHCHCWWSHYSSLFHWHSYLIILIGKLFCCILKPCLPISRYPLEFFNSFFFLSKCLVLNLFWWKWFWPESLL